MIYKELIESGVEKTFPLDAIALKVKLQGDDLCLWYEFNPGAYEDTRIIKFHVVGTGEETDTSEWEYLETVFQDNYVWHIFAEEVIE